MSCSKCGSNGLTSCSCHDNCPTQTSEIFFDGTLNNITVPEGSTVNDVLILLEQFTLDTVNALNFEYTATGTNCLGLPAGTYGYSQIFDAVNAALCSLQSDVANIQSDITDIQSDITDIQTDITDIQTDVTNIQSDITTIETNITESMPLGSMIMFATATPPSSKWLMCQGQALSTAVYPDLFALIGYSFGGIGISFNLPDLRNKFVAGYNSSGPSEYQTIGQGGGQDSVALLKPEIPKHQHTIGNSDGGSISDPGDHNHRGGESFNTILEGGSLQPGDQSWDLDEGGVAGPNLYRTGLVPYADGAHTHTGETGDGTSDGLSGVPHENRPAFVVFPWMIKVLN
jgi:microcystin-dependent protein